MQCPNLVEWVDWVILLCKAGERPYVPSLFELKECCKSEEHRRCPFYYLKNIAVKKEMDDPMPVEATVNKQSIKR
mgnify:FL=1